MIAELRQQIDIHFMVSRQLRRQLSPRLSTINQTAFHATNRGHATNTEFDGPESPWMLRSMRAQPSMSTAVIYLLDAFVETTV